MDSDKAKFQYQGIKFLFDWELLNEPQVIHTIKVNVLGRFPWVIDLEYIFRSEPRKELIMWLHTPKRMWWKKRKEAQLRIDVLEIMQQLLPKYEIRIVTDRKIFEMALENVRKLSKAV